MCVPSSNYLDLFLLLDDNKKKVLQKNLQLELKKKKNYSGVLIICWVNSCKPFHWIGNYT